MTEQEIDDGGDAFPVADDSQMYLGMTLRDWFAGQALSGILTTLIVPKASGAEYAGKAVARNAYRIADAMIEHRKGE